MKILNRPRLMKVHTVLAAFILPVAIMFFVTGAFYTWGVKGAYETVVYNLDLENPIDGEVSALVPLVTEALAQQKIETPSGGAKIKRIGQSFRLEWTGSKKDIVLEPTKNPLIAKLTIKKTSWYRQFVQLHKAKGGTPFKVYAAIFATVLLLLLVTGFMMAWQTPKLRKLTLLSASLGLVVFFVMVIFS